MKRFFKSRLTLTLATFIIVAAAIVIPLSNSNVHTHAQSQLLPYPTAVLADQPVLYYRLGDSSVSNGAQDTSGNGHTGSYSGGVTLGLPGALAGDPDTSAAFDGSTGIVDSGTNVISTSSTIEAWIRPTSAQGCISGPGCSLGQEAIAGTGGSFQLTYGRLPQTVRVWLWPSDNTDWHYLDAPGSVPLNTWSYIATTWDDTTKLLSIYINGTPSASLLLPGVTSSYQSFNSLPFTFNLAGFEPAPQQQYQGGLDEVAYYNHALSADRILAHYQAAIPCQVINGLPSEGCALQAYTRGDHLQPVTPGALILEDVQFFPALDFLNACARANNVVLTVVSTFRPITGNPGVPNSDHLAGHAIDVKFPVGTGLWPPPPPGGTWPLRVQVLPGSHFYNELAAIPATAQAVINCATPLLRWGGNFAGGVVGAIGWDPVHFDDDLFHLDPTDYAARLSAVQSDWTNVLQPAGILRCCPGPLAE